MSVAVLIQLPAHLRLLASTPPAIALSVEAPVTQRSVLDALEVKYPMLEGTIRDHATKLRRPFLRFFAGEEDLSHRSPDDPLPEEVAQGQKMLLIIGAIAGG